MSIGERITQRMEQLGVTQAQLSREVGITQVSTMRIRTGQSENIKAVTALKLAKSLKCNINWLVLGRGPVESESSQPLVNAASLIVAESTHAKGYKVIATIGAPVDGDNLLAFCVNDDLIDLPQNSTLFVETKSKPESGQYALYIAANGNLIARKYRNMGAATLLEATASNIPDQYRFTELTEDIKLIGKVIAYTATL
ncbi:helix-turn-helix domain-containing protein [Vibrio galatheae]|uniref:helix-turn-helix domain-containing protein n=1 Tax=Vibrio galatheae TaxID=579748 RepID=UPI000697DD9C|nr:helix-turn-helix domain-containing protein [Vibrio galatheae]